MENVELQMIKIDSEETYIHSGPLGHKIEFSIPTP